MAELTLAYNANKDIVGINEWLQANVRVERKTAFSPSPENGALVNQTWSLLSWEPGATAASHDVYVSDNFDDLSSGMDTARPYTNL